VLTISLNPNFPLIFQLIPHSIYFWQIIMEYFICIAHLICKHGHRNACFTTYLTGRLPFQDLDVFYSLFSKKLPVSLWHPPMPADHITNTLEMLDLLNSMSTTYPTSTELVLINVLRPGRTLSPLKSVKNRKRADFDAMTLILCKSTCLLLPNKQQSLKKELYLTNKCLMKLR